MSIANQLYHNVIAKMNETQRQALNEAIEAVKPVVNAIESQPQLTKDWYDKYLDLAKDMNSVLVLLCAGANKHGVVAAAKINQVL